MSSKTMWCHHTRNILNCNRITHNEPVLENEDQDPEEVKKVMEAKDPFEKRLKLISDDTTI